jgi:hypothetical protein
MANLAGLAALAALGYGAHEYFKNKNKVKDAAPTVKEDDKTNSATVASNLLKDSGPTITPEMKAAAIAEGNKVSDGERVAMSNRNIYDIDTERQAGEPAKKKPIKRPVKSSNTRSVGKLESTSAPAAESEEDRISRMGKLMSNYKPRYTPPGQAPKTTVSPSRPPMFPPGTPPEEVDNSVPEMRSNIMGQKRGGMVKKMASGGMTSKPSSASRRGDGIAQKGKTNCKMR